MHSHYNNNNDDDDDDDSGNNIAFWYFGHNVYILNNLDAYLIAYVAEGICFVAAIALRLYWDHCSGCGVSSRQAELKSTSFVSATSGDIMKERYYENVLMEKNQMRTNQLWCIQSLLCQHRASSCDCSTQHPHKQVKSWR